MLCSWGLSVGASTRYVIKQKVSISLYIFIFPAQDLHFLPCPRFLRLPFYYLWSPENCDRVFCSCMLAIPLRARFNWTSVISDLLTRFKRRPLLRMQVKAKEFAQSVCRAHPEQQFEKAVIHFITQLERCRAPRLQTLPWKMAARLLRDVDNKWECFPPFSDGYPQVKSLWSQVYLFNVSKIPLLSFWGVLHGCFAVKSPGANCLKILWFPLRRIISQAPSEINYFLFGESLDSKTSSFGCFGILTICWADFKPPRHHRRLYKCKPWHAFLGQTMIRLQFSDVRCTQLWYAGVLVSSFWFHKQNWTLFSLWQNATGDWFYRGCLRHTDSHFLLQTWLVLPCSSNCNCC